MRHTVQVERLLRKIPTEYPIVTGRTETNYIYIRPFVKNIQYTVEITPRIAVVIVSKKNYVAFTRAQSVITVYRKPVAF